MELLLLFGKLQLLQLLLCRASNLSRRSEKDELEDIIIGTRPLSATIVKESSLLDKSIEEFKKSCRAVEASMFLFIFYLLFSTRRLFTFSYEKKVKRKKAKHQGLA